MPQSFAGLEQLDILLDPSLPVKTLLSLRQLANAAHAGFLTREQAARGAAHIGLCADLFSSQTSQGKYLELAEALGAIIRARSASARDLTLQEDEPMLRDAHDGGG
jgi:hypothetical protein